MLTSTVQPTPSVSPVVTATIPLTIASVTLVIPRVETYVSRMERVHRVVKRTEAAIASRAGAVRTTTVRPTPSVYPAGTVMTRSTIASATLDIPDAKVSVSRTVVRQARSLTPAATVSRPGATPTFNALLVRSEKKDANATTPATIATTCSAESRSPMLEGGTNELN